MDRELAITGGGVLETIIGNSAREERYRTILMGVFAAPASGSGSFQAPKPNPQVAVRIGVADRRPSPNRPKRAWRIS